jgi:deazaflavin-dependent oxidoreductase (nitroreductase family)
MKYAAAKPRMRALRPFTIRLVNPITRLFAGHVPWFAIVIHRGRKTGQTYRTPLNIFRDGADYIVALTYGSDVQWVKNVLAAGACEIEVRGRTVPLRDPRLSIDARASLMPLPVRFFLRLLSVEEFLRLSPA